jgi:hypothetical protein
MILLKQLVGPALTSIGSERLASRQRWLSASAKVTLVAPRSTPTT